MAHDVFISYSNLDRTVADAAVAVLESQGIRCWIAPRDVTPGLDWSAEIVDAIERASVMVLIYSRNANESPQIKREVERGVNRGMPVIPFRIEDVPLSKALEYFISSPHWLDAMTPPLERHLRYLADTVQLLLARNLGASGDDVRKRIGRRRRWGDVLRKVRLGLLATIALIVVGAGAWVWGRLGARPDVSGGNGARRDPTLDSLLDAVRRTSAKPVASSAAPTDATPEGAVDPALVGTWESSAAVNGQTLRSTFVVASTGGYRLETVVADSGRFALMGPRAYRLIPSTGGQIDMRDDGIDATKATLTGPLGTQEWHRVGFPTDSRYLIVGEWRTTQMRDGVPWQMALVVNERRWDYHLVSTSDDEGTLVARGGTWTKRSRTVNDAASNGTYRLSDARTMSFTGPLGTSTWTRVR